MPNMNSIVSYGLVNEALKLTTRHWMTDRHKTKTIPIIQSGGIQIAKSPINIRWIANNAASRVEGDLWMREV